MNGDLVPVPHLPDVQEGRTLPPNIVKAGLLIADGRGGWHFANVAPHSVQIDIHYPQPNLGSLYFDRVDTGPRRGTLTAEMVVDKRENWMYWATTLDGFTDMLKEAW